MYGYALVHRVAAVGGDAVHADEPAVLAVHKAELAAVFLDAGRAHCHVVRHGRYRTGVAHADIALLACHQVHAQQHAAVGAAHDVLQQLALAAARGALVHHDHLVLIGRDYPRRGGVGRDPALLLAYVEQHAVDALLRRGAGVEVVGEDLVQALHPVVHHDLLAVKVRVPEGRRGIDDGARLEVVHRPYIHKGLQLRHGKAEESRVPRADQHRLVAVIIAAGLEGHQYELLPGQPAQGLHPQLVKLISVYILKPRLIRRQVVGNAHAVWVAPAHIVLGIVHCGAVAAADDLSLFDYLAMYVVEHLDLARVLVSEYELKEHLLAGRDDDARAVVNDPAELLRERKSLKKYVHAYLTFRAR